MRILLISSLLTLLVACTPQANSTTVESDAASAQLSVNSDGQATELSMDEAKAAFEKAFEGMTVESITEAPIDGFYQVSVRGEVVYFSKDGDHLVTGDVIDVATRTSLTDEARGVLQAKAVEGLDEATMLVYEPEGQRKGYITVFTDTTCGYCRKLHAELPQLAEAGIAVRYLMYPRAGLASDSFNTLQSIWCADDKHAAMDAAKKGEQVDTKQCENPIASHVEIAHTMGLRGTPLIVTDKGRVISGYRPANELIEILEM